MSDGFNELVVRAQAFFTELKDNNTRDWFAKRKDFYNQDIRAPGILFSEIMAEEISRVTGTGHTPKVYRLYRDVRFAKDKSPFNPWLHMMWSAQGMADDRPWFFFGIDHDVVFLAAGVLGLQKEGLTRYRAFVDRRGDELTDVIDDSGAELVNYGPEPLKRVPKPYDPDHPHGDLLRRKGLILQRAVNPTHPDGLVASVRQELMPLLPFHKLLSSM